MKNNEYLRLPVSGAGCGSIRVTANSIELKLEYEYVSENDDINHVGQIKFYRTGAYRFRKEILSAGFIEASYDSIVEVKNSKWHKELIKKEPTDVLFSVKEKKHYALLLSNNGYLEVIAESLEVLPDKKGYLADY